MHTIIFNFSELGKLSNFILSTEGKIPWFSIEWVYGFMQFRTNDKLLYYRVLGSGLMEVGFRLDSEIRFTPPLKINETFLENFVSSLFEMCKYLKYFEYSIFSQNGEVFFMTENKELYKMCKEFISENYF